jgi:transposase
VVTTLRYIAIDLHKKYAVVAEKVDGSPEIKSSRFRLTPAGVQTFRRNVDANCRIVIEATGNAFWLHDQLCPVAGEVILANPGQLKAIATARIKHDKLDATVMVQLLAADFIPRVWIPDPKTRAQRSLLSHRFSLRRSATRCKNQVHAALIRNLHVARPFTREGRRRLAEVQLTPEDRAMVDSNLRILDYLEGELKAIGGELNAEAMEGPRKEDIQLAMSLPGLDVLGASLLVARIGDITRFPDGDHLASYWGLVPSLHQSGNVNRRGHITKAGCPEARHILVQAAWAVVRHYRDTPLYAFYERVAQRRGQGVAIVALARKLATILWQVLTKREPCRHCRPATLARKIRRARRNAARYPVMTDAERAERLASLLADEVAAGSG